MSCPQAHPHIWTHPRPHHAPLTSTHHSTQFTVVLNDEKTKIKQLHKELQEANQKIAQLTTQLVGHVLGEMHAVLIWGCLDDVQCNIDFH